MPGVQAQSQARAVLSGTIADETGALIRGAGVQLATADSPSTVVASQGSTDEGTFSFTVAPGSYVIRVEAIGFATYVSGATDLKSGARVKLAVRLGIESHREEISVLDEGETSGTDLSGAASTLVFEGDTLKLLSNDSSTLQQELRALAGGSSSPVFLVDGFSGSRIPPKSSIRSIRINRNQFSAYFADYGVGRVEISTKPGTDQLHGAMAFTGTDQPLNANNPYTTLQPPYYEFQQDGNLSGAWNRKTSWFISENVLQLANNAVVNATDPQAPDTAISEAIAAPQNSQTYSARVDRQFSTKNFAYVRDEWSRTHVTNSGIVPLVLPSAAYTADTLSNALQLSDTQVISARAVNETRFQYLRTRVRQDPNSTAPSVLVQGAFQGGGSLSQVLRDNQDAYELQDLFEADRGHHSLRTGMRLRVLRDGNESSAGFNGQYIFPDVASYQAGAPTQFSVNAGQEDAVLTNSDVAVFAEDDWKITPNLTLSYGLRFESQSAIPDHSDPAPRFGFSWAIRRGKRTLPLLTLRGGYGIFYDRFPAAQLLQAERQNGVREIGYVAQNTAFDPSGPPPGIVLTAAEPTVFQVDPALRSSYDQVGALTASRSLGRFGSVSGNLLYAHNTHNFLTRNANAPLPGTVNPANPASGMRPLGTELNQYQFASRANGNLERFYLNYQLKLPGHLFLFGVFAANKNFNESDGVDHFASNAYDIRQDYGRAAIDRAQDFTGGLLWTLPHDIQVTPFLAVRSGLPFDITTGADNNGDTIYNDRPGVVTSASTAVAGTPLGTFDIQPEYGQSLYPRNAGTAPGFLWLDFKVGKDFHVGPRPRASASAAGKGSAAQPDRPWTLNFSVDAQNLTNHNNPGLPVGAISAQPCGSGTTAPCSCPVSGQCLLAPSRYFGHSLSLATDLSPVTASNRTILLQTSFTF